MRNLYHIVKLIKALPSEYTKLFGTQHTSFNIKLIIALYAVHNYTTYL